MKYAFELRYRGSCHSILLCGLWGLSAETLSVLNTSFLAWYFPHRGVDCFSNISYISWIHCGGARQKPNEARLQLWMIAYIQQLISALISTYRRGYHFGQRQPASHSGPCRRTSQSTLRQKIVSELQRLIQRYLPEKQYGPNIPASREKVTLHRALFAYSWSSNSSAQDPLATLKTSAGWWGWLWQVSLLLLVAERFLPVVSEWSDFLPLPPRLVM